MDEVEITRLRDRLRQLEELEARKDSVLKSLEKHGHLTDELAGQVAAAAAMTELEDIYLPYRPKRRTRATMAREKGLQPLADELFAQAGKDPEALAGQFIDPDNGVESVEDALAGARDIIAELVNENKEAREKLRSLFMEKGVITSKVVTGKEKEGAKFKDYFEWSEPAKTSPSHRVLAIRRGEKEDMLNFSILPQKDEAIAILESMFATGEGEDAQQVRLAIADGYSRMLAPSMETETRLAVKERADTEAIEVFTTNLRQLLLAPPLGSKRVMALDPGFRTGCKLVCMDRQGKLLFHDTIYPHKGQRERMESEEKVRKLCETYSVEAIAVGNGTAGRETEAFLLELNLPADIAVIMVNESGASIYSASETAREEFPDLDLTVRGAVSIGRRLMDPLAELVKIDAKSIGVGQYQHDVDQNALKTALDDMVVSCVNGVGVDLNRASVQLLTYVSGLGPVLAKNIVTHRNENGPFAGRKALLKVPRLGPKAFEQSAGFLRIVGGENPLDASAVHPERYDVVYAMAKDQGCGVEQLMKDGSLRNRIRLEDYVTDDAGLPTLDDIMQELAKPGRDPRQPFELFRFDDSVNKISDLTPGMKLPGIVTNVTAFGAFVDIGVHQDGLVHISEMADHFVKAPSDIVTVQQKVKVTVLDVDLDRKRISLSMKSGKAPVQKRPEANATRKKKTIQKPKGKKQNTPFNNPFADLLSGK